MSEELPSKKQETKAFFGELAAPGFGLDAAFFTAIGQRLTEFAYIPPQGQVLDMAAGTGANLFPAAEKVGKDGRVIGIDLAEAMVKGTTAEIIDRGLHNVEMRQMDAEKLDFPDASFDRVLCGFALFFFPQLDRTLFEVSRVLKPGGVFVASTFAAQGYPWSWYETLLKAYKLSSRVDRLVGLVTEPLERPKDIEEALKRTGFVHIHIETEEYDDRFEDEEAWWQRLWSSADEDLLRRLNQERLQRFRRDAFEQLQSLKGKDGIHGRYKVLLASGTKSST